MLWLAIEINTLTFIGLFSINTNKRETIIVYFITQSLRRFFLIRASLWAENYLSSVRIGAIILLRLFIKLGVAPFHNWIYPVITNRNKILLFLFLIIQKIIPLIWILTTKLFRFRIFLGARLLNLLMISPQNITQTAIKLLLGISRMSHSRWIILRLISLRLLEIYFFVYALIFITIIFIRKDSLKNFFQKKNPYIILVILFILGGIPPLIGFYPKLLVLHELRLLNIWTGGVALLTFSLIDLFVYTQLGVRSSLFRKKKIKWIKDGVKLYGLILWNLCFIPVLWL